MLDKFLSYIKAQKLITAEDNILLAVSGGIDSMVMLQLFNDAAFKIGVAHINHHLRGKESDEDAAFVHTFCNKFGIPFYLHEISPESFFKGNMHDISRKIRYEWLQKVAKEYQYSAIATAHHSDDATETFFINIIRGTGVDGLSGIREIHGNIIRPMLFATKNDIEEYANSNDIPYREDSSNAGDKYLRNRIRHHILPAVYQSDHRAKQGIHTTIRHIKQSNALLHYFLNDIKKQTVYHHDNEIRLDLKMISTHPFKEDILYYLIKEYGYNHNQCLDILQGLQASGNRFLSDGYEAILSRQTLIIRKTADVKEEIFVFVVSPPCTIVYGGYRYTFEITTHENIVFKSEEIQYLNMDQLKFPLTLRTWQKGDIIHPLGMQGKSQKLKDIYINQKLNLFEKKNILVLEFDGEIIAVPGMKISERVKITATTKNVLKVSRLPFHQIS